MSDPPSASHYGTFHRSQTCSIDGMPDIERVASNGEGSSFRSSQRREKDIVMRPLLDQASRPASLVSEDSFDSAQAGVKVRVLNRIYASDSFANLRSDSKRYRRPGVRLACILPILGERILPVYQCQLLIRNSIALLSFAMSLEQQTTINLTIFATSAFSSHALVATVGVVSSVVMSVAKPPMSKVADVFGRFEAFSLSVLIYIIGYIQQAAADSVRTYAAAQIFYSAGQTGLQILIQIFIADTSDLLNRALCTTLPNIPFLATVWIGPTLAQRILDTISWRWGYGIWAIILPLAFMPLALAMFVNQKRAAKLGILPKSQFEGLTTWESVATLWYELDIFGLVLICAAFSLILIPLTMAADEGWKSGPTLAMLVIGVVCLLAFPLWERSKRLAPRAFFPRDLLRNRTVIAGMFLAFFYFSKSFVIYASLNAESLQWHSTYQSIPTSNHTY